MPSEYFVKTPLIRSSHLSSRLGADVYLKLENLQPCHSFKLRGMSHYLEHQLAAHSPSMHVVCASSGNAGISAAYASRALGLKCTVFLPEGVHPATTEYLKSLGAELVVIPGKYFAHALRAAEEAVKTDKNAVLAPAYNDPLLWEGHSSMIHEIKEQLPSDVLKPDVILCSVGGAGLLGGVLTGCKDVGWDDVPVVTVETHGSNCFYESMAANRNPSYAPSENVAVRRDETHGVLVAHIHQLTSIVISLGANYPAPAVVKMALDRPGNIRCVTVPDELTMQTARMFADFHKMLVELACSATLAPAYKLELAQHLFPAQGSGRRAPVLVFIMCGGFKITTEELVAFENTINNIPKGTQWELRVDEDVVKVDI